MMQTAIIRRNYAMSKDANLFERVAQEYAPDRYQIIEGSSVAIAPNETRYFQFHISALVNVDKGREVWARGKGDFRHFGLVAQGKEQNEWLAWSSDMLIHRVAMHGR
jgi:hypothetical protein